MASLKDTIISSMRNGPEVLADIVAMKRNGKDYIVDRFQTKSIVDKYHPKKLSLKVVDIIVQNSIAKTFRFVSTEGALPIFEAGQYINIFTKIDNVLTSRPYSISSSPKQRSYIEITVAKIPDGFVSDYFLDNVKVGDEFEANGPAGNLRYNPVFHKKKSVFLAGGSGITPFVSMTREILETGLDRDIVLIYGSRKKELAIFHDELEELSKKHSNFSYNLVLSDEKDKAYKAGFIDDACIKEIVGNVADCSYYLCGPNIMTEFCTKALATLGIKESQVRHEVFGTRRDIENEAGWPSSVDASVTFKVDVAGKTIDAKANESLLTSLERNGILVKVCCRSGECSYCRARLVSGEVFMPKGVLLRLADEKFGYIHTCKAYPISDVKLEL